MLANLIYIFDAFAFDAYSDPPAKRHVYSHLVQSSIVDAKDDSTQISVAFRVVPTNHKIILF